MKCLRYKTLPSIISSAWTFFFLLSPRTFFQTILCHWNPVFTAPHCHSWCHFSLSSRASLKGSLRHGTLLRKMRTEWRTDTGISLHVSIDGVIVLGCNFLPLCEDWPAASSSENLQCNYRSILLGRWRRVHIKGRKNCLNTPTMSVCLAMGLVSLLDLRCG